MAGIPGVVDFKTQDEHATVPELVEMPCSIEETLTAINTVMAQVTKVDTKQFIHNNKGGEFGTIHSIYSDLRRAHDAITRIQAHMNNLPLELQDQINGI